MNKYSKKHVACPKEKCLLKLFNIYIYISLPNLHILLHLKTF